MKEKYTSRTGRTILLTILVFLILLVSTFFIVTRITPVPVARLIRKAFENPPQTPPAGYAAIQEQVTIVSNLSYATADTPPAWQNAVLDLYRPVEEQQPLPMILWVHGGGFVGGDKTDLSIYATILASKGYAVASINYDLAPEAKYPTPLHQLQAAHDFLREQQETYHLDMSQLALAGDSAGAQIVAQWAVSQTNPAYATEYDFANTTEDIKALLLYCGPYDIKQLAEVPSHVVSFFLNQVAFAYLDERQWQDTPAAQGASVIDFVTRDFPPSFVTDGNTASFQNHGEQLAKTLEAAEVPVHTLFFTEEHITNHEYQFSLDTPEGMQSLKETLAFLEEYLPTNPSE